MQSIICLSRLIQLCSSQTSELHPDQAKEVQPLPKCKHISTKPYTDSETVCQKRVKFLGLVVMSLTINPIVHGTSLESPIAHFNVEDA